MIEEAPAGAITGWTAIPNWIARDPDIKPGVKMVLIVLMSRVNQSGTCWPAIGTIARESGQSEKSVRRHLATLRDMGLVTWKQRRTPRGDLTSSAYSLHVTSPLREGSGHSDQGVGSQRPDGLVALTEELNPVEEDPVEEETGGGAARSTTGEKSHWQRDVSNARETATKPEPSAQTSGGSAAPQRRPDRCTRPAHQAARQVIENCQGCMKARRAWLRSEELRDLQVTQGLRDLDNQPPCEHGQPGGTHPHPAFPSGPPLCPLCRTKAPGDPEPPTMTADDAARLQALLTAADASTDTGVTPSILEHTP